MKKIDATTGRVTAHERNRLAEEPVTPRCEECGGEAVVKVNGHLLCEAHVDLASEEGEEPRVEAAE